MSKEFKTIKVIENFLAASIPAGILPLVIGNEWLTTVLVGLAVAGYGFLKWQYKNQLSE